MVEKKTYTEQQVKESALFYFSGDELAANVWAKKYALKAKNGLYEELSPEDTVKRVAKEIAREELKHPNALSYDEIYETLKNFKYFIFGGSILFGIGNNNTVSSLGNCFFIDNGEDSYGGIFNLDEQIVQLMKRRGGVGITLEHLRPSLASVNNSAQTSTGATSFMNRFSSSTREVAQDGRRGALMITCNVNHPDITNFIESKDDLTKITGANISVKITDKFMKAVENNEDYVLSWPFNEQVSCTEEIPYNKLTKLENGSYVKKTKAKDIWNLIIKQAYKNAEPGVLFWDTIINESPADCYKKHGFATQGTNPCAEVPLSTHDSCRLGSINLYSFVEQPFEESSRFDWGKLGKVSRQAQRFMDDVVGLEEEKISAIISKVENDPESVEIKQTELNMWKKILNILKKGRRTGIGVLGLADTFAALGLKYGTQEATKFESEVQKFIALNCYKESVKLAKERGCFPVWDAKLESDNPFIKRVVLDNFNSKEYEDYLKYGRRNIANLSVAPTGSLAMLAQTSSGIEPVFKIFYRRRRKINPNENGSKVAYIDVNGDSWEEYNVIHYPFVEWYITKRKKDLTEKGEEITEDLSFNEVLNEFMKLSEESLVKLVAESPWAKCESHDIDYIEKINMQGEIQKWVDHSISITHNLPEKISVEEVNKIYFHSWKVGCKGMTIYRENSRSGVLLSNKKDDEEFKESNAPKRPRILESDYYVARADGKEYAVIIGLWKNTNKPYEVFAFENPPMNKNTKGKTIKVKKGHYKFVNGEFEIENLQLATERKEEKMLTLTASMLLRHGAPIKHVNHVITKIDENITSFSSVVRRYLSKYIQEETMSETCPECGAKLTRQDGCIKCVTCGWSKC
jgi:ribonucleoside-diphosphate reductase alpha chain